LSRKLKDWISGYLEWTKEDESPEIYRKWCAISGLAACLQRKCYHRLGRLVFYPNFYIALVGPSGVRKSTAIAPIKTLLQERGVELAASVTSKEKLIGAIVKLGSKDDMSAREGRERFLLDQPLSPHASLTAISGELILFFPQKDMGFVKYLLDLYDNPDVFIYDTYKRGEEMIENVWFNLLGGITPDELNRSMTEEMVGAGFLGRFIIVYASKIGKLNGYPVETKEEKTLRRYLVEDMQSVLMMSGPFKPTPEWLELYLPWYENPETHQLFEGTKLDAYSTRRGSHIHKLSMISSASRNDSRVMKAEDFERAHFWLTQIEKRMLEAVGGIGSTQYGQNVDAVIGYLRSKGDKVPFSQLLSRFMTMIQQDDLMQILFALKQTGTIELKNRLTGEPAPFDKEVVARYIPRGE